MVYDGIYKWAIVPISTRERCWEQRLLVPGLFVKNVNISSFLIVVYDGIFGILKIMGGGLIIWGAFLKQVVLINFFLDMWGLV